ncbi:hypothetical protein [Micrococcus luteus]|uniref:hypothetical protein n=1 Tax=Micrococcus luteus TaxID=1270 RepID=UPI0019D02C63|nr:hypothetical protein [Micrococcus luteus]MBN6751059.1 hypothetical protein [Micrococcus luteus]MBN6760647.1 hypothetical protein [Micrococcus luteus]MBN6801337.1 hypothetical protein [Micrococcus luteus]
MSDLDCLATAWRLALFGTTRADVIGLQWEDAGPNIGTVTVSQRRVQSISTRCETYVGDPKCAQRVRTIHVEAMRPGPIDLRRALEARQARRQLQAGAAWHATGCAVIGELGRQARSEWYSGRFRALCRKAGVPSIRLYAVQYALAHLLHPNGAYPLTQQSCGATA